MHQFNAASLQQIENFGRFRMNLVSFLRLPHNVSETALRDVLRKCSTTLLKSYLVRADTARASFSADDEPGEALSWRPHAATESNGAFRIGDGSPS